MAEPQSRRAPEFSFTVELDGAQRDFSLPLHDRARADLFARRTLDLLAGIGALKDGSITVGQKSGDEFQPVAAWTVADGAPPVRAPFPRRAS